MDLRERQAQLIELFEGLDQNQRAAPAAFVLQIAFPWGLTKQGFRYWELVQRNLRNLNEADA